MSTTRDIICLVCGETIRWDCSSEEEEVPRQCLRCGASRIKYRISEDGNVTEEYPENDLPTGTTIEENASPKAKILGELYAIRSVLSIISENWDAIERSKKNLINKYYANFTKNARQHMIERHMGKWAKYKVSTIKAELSQKTAKAEKDLEELQKEYEIKQNEVVGFFQRRAKKRQLLNLQNQIYAKRNLISKLKNEIKDFDNKSRYPIGTYIDETLVITGDRFTYYSESRDVIKQIHVDYLKLSLDVLDNKAKWFPLPSSIRDVLQWVTPQEKEKLDNFIESRKSDSRELIDNARIVYKIIDFRDWGNVDLIIYYFETGRADDLKEALQLVDRQLQTNQLVEAIRMASNQIEETIYQSTKALGGALADSFSLLSKQMNEQAQATRDMISEQTQKMNQMREVQISNQIMANALLSNISKSSAELAEDMNRQMKLVYGIY